MFHGCLAIAPAKAPGQQGDLVIRQTKGLGHVTHCTLSPITDDRGRQGGTRPPVLGVDVLQHFLATLVFEVHIDIRRLITLHRNEPGHEQATFGWVDRGDPQREAHRRVGRRTTALAKDSLAARKADDVFHGQEEGLVLLHRNQLQLLVDLMDDVGWRAFRPAHAHARLGQYTQVRGRRVSFRHQFGRVAVPDLVQGEVAAPGQGDRCRQQRMRVDIAQCMAGTQVAFPVAEQVGATLSQRQPMANGGHGVLQDPLASHVHMHIPRCNRLHLHLLCQIQQGSQLLRIVLLAMQLDGQERTLTENAA